MRKSHMSIAALIGGLLVFSLLPLGLAFSQQLQRVQVSNFPQVQTVQVANFPETQEVEVGNFPEVQEIKGTVSVAGTIRHGTIRWVVNETVPPGIAREAVSDLIDAGIVSTDGFTGVVLSLQGEVQGVLGEAGGVGALLVPNDTEVIAKLIQGYIHFPLEVQAVLARREISVFSQQSFQTVGFPAYKVFLYNATDKAIDLDLYLYLTN